MHRLSIESSYRPMLTLGLTVVLALSAGPAISGAECDPSFYYLFRGEAEEALERLPNDTTRMNRLKRLVLLHNLAFEKDKQARSEAEKLLKKHFPEESWSPVEKGFVGSLKMIKVSHRSTGSNALRKISPFSKSPRDEALEGFEMIDEAVEADQDSHVLRILRATAGAETLEHLPELYDVTHRDLDWLSDHTPPGDTVLNYLTELAWAKYYYKVAGEEPRLDILEMAQTHLDSARSLACTPVYREWVDLWQDRIDERLSESGPQ